MAITGTAAAGAAASSTAMATATAVAVAASVAATALQMKNASDLAEQQAEAQKKNNEAKMHALEDNYSQLSKITCHFSSLKTKQMRGGSTRL